MSKLKLPKRNEVMNANPFKRIGAFLIDLLILQIIVLSSFSSYFEKNFSSTGEGFMATYNLLSSNQGLLMQLYYVIISISVIFFIYFVYMEYKYSQTLGMMLFKQHVKSNSSNDVSLWQSIIRNLFLIPIFPLFFLWVIDPIYFLFKGERLSEILSKTSTVEVLNYGY